MDKKVFLLTHVLWANKWVKDINKTFNSFSISNKIPKNNEGKSLKKLDILYLIKSFDKVIFHKTGDITFFSNSLYIRLWK